MASVVDLSNLALAHLGDAATVSSISPSDGSAQADHCARFYPVARDLLLEMADWNFARRRVALAETVNTPPDHWAYEYAYPNSCVRILAVLDEGGDENAPRKFMQGSDSAGNRVIWTNEASATCLYTHLVTDTTKFSPMFAGALTWLLASYLAGPITKDMKVKESMLKIFNSEFSKAAASSANANKYEPTYTPEAMAIRGYVSPYQADGRIAR